MTGAWRLALPLLAIGALPFTVSETRPGEQAHPGLVAGVHGALRLRGGGSAAVAETSWFSGGLQGMRKHLDVKIAELGGKGPAPVDLPPVDTVHDSIDIKATPDEVFHVATDFLEYPKWAGAISSVKIVQGGDPPRTVDFRMGMFGITLNNRFKYTYSRPGKVDWYAAPGSSVKELVGAYRFKATAGGTRAEYSLLVDPGFPLPSAIRKVPSRLPAMHPPARSAAVPPAEPWASRQRRGRSSTPRSRT